MHNVRRTKPGTLSDDEVQRQREQERERLDAYRAVEGAFFTQVCSCDGAGLTCSGSSRP